MDGDVQRVAEFMQGNVPADKLTAVAISLAQIAPALWGRYGAQEIAALQLVADPISLSGHNMRPASSEHRLG